jgi:hypothetical protein
MLAKELAEILLQNPECEVKIFQAYDSSAGKEVNFEPKMISGPWRCLLPPYDNEILFDPEGED